MPLPILMKLSAAARTLLKTPAGRKAVEKGSTAVKKFLERHEQVINPHGLLKNSPQIQQKLLLLSLLLVLLAVLLVMPMTNMRMKAPAGGMVIKKVALLNLLAKNLNLLMVLHVKVRPEQNTGKKIHY